MNAETKNQSRSDAVISAIGVLVLLLGAASGSARVMLALAVIGLVVIPVFCRQRMGRTAWLAMGVSATIAIVTAFFITMSG